MGDRGQVKIVDTGIYLYTHWDAAELPWIVQKALARKKRWRDPCYLARIIFCEMIKDDLDGGTGYGICSEKHGDVWRVVEVNCSQGIVRVIDLGEVILEMSFEQFIRMTEFEFDLLLALRGT